MPLVPPGNRKKREPSEHVGHEQPGTVLRGPPISMFFTLGGPRLQ
jgi:hypothetical protein